MEIPVTLMKMGLDEAKQLKAYLVAQGVPKDDILVETESVNTHENAEMARQVTQGGIWFLLRYLLITSAYHMRPREGLL